MTSLRPRSIGGRLLTVWFCLLFTGCYWISDTERDERWDLDADGVERPTDCDDDDPDLSEIRTFFRDSDGDGYGDPEDAVDGCKAPEGYVDDNTDCRDDDRSIFPTAVEICNSIDDDCDLAVDEDTALIRFYRDSDNDGAGDLEDVIEACVRPDGYVAVGDDCNDSDPYVNPNAEEICNGYDDDCDDEIDLDDSSFDPALATWYLDDDGDDFGRDDRVEISCDPPPGYVAAGGDCDDGDDEVNPDADERCNDRDDDCDEATDEDAIDALRSYPDEDGDGYGDDAFPTDSCVKPEHHVFNGGDCDDDALQSNIGAEEWCATGEDEDCDGAIDEPGCIAPPPPQTGATGDTGSATAQTGDTGS